jgi:hypothetical protein
MNLKFAHLATSQNGPVHHVCEDGDKRISFSEFLDMMKGVQSKKKKDQGWRLNENSELRQNASLKIESRGAEKQGITQTDIQDEIEVVVSSANKGDFT